jgi:hypothetical protein
VQCAEGVGLMRPGFTSVPSSATGSRGSDGPAFRVLMATASVCLAFLASRPVRVAAPLAGGPESPGSPIWLRLGVLLPAFLILGTTQLLLPVWHSSACRPDQGRSKSGRQPRVFVVPQARRPAGYGFASYPGW